MLETEMSGEEWCCECDAFPEVRLHQWATLVAWWWGSGGPIYEGMHIVEVGWAKVECAAPDITANLARVSSF